MQWVVGIIVVWAVAFGWPAAWLAGERGRGIWTWFFIGAIYGPVAIFILGFAPMGIAGTFRECPDCLEAVRAGASTCPHCGTELLVEG
jgi:hypothetical protein